jgi:hypothetical protein
LEVDVILKSSPHVEVDAVWMSTPHVE